MINLTSILESESFFHKLKILLMFIFQALKQGSCLLGKAFTFK